MKRQRVDALLADLQNSINPGRVNSPGGRTSSPGARTNSPGRTGSPLGRGSSPGRLSSPGGSLSSPTSTGYGSINGSRNITTDYAKPASVQNYLRNNVVKDRQSKENWSMLTFLKLAKDAYICRPFGGP
ncbi:jg5641 [Pararge aegeria aegeria]|uniref:Jg5641 protein n=1 Tax=Pararge aegeria aegeria TaxID=348720 RepID=A0A8S4QPP2_9NEOP|nr:jg5641 [Pararge aegeria aegeria]